MLEWLFDVRRKTEDGRLENVGIVEMVGMVRMVRMVGQ
jgi:hypothetical protein